MSTVCVSFPRRSEKKSQARILVVEVLHKPYLCIEDAMGIKQTIGDQNYNVMFESY